MRQHPSLPVLPNMVYGTKQTTGGGKPAEHLSISFDREEPFRELSMRSPIAQLLCGALWLCPASAYSLNVAALLGRRQTHPAGPPAPLAASATGPRMRLSMLEPQASAVATR